MHLIRFTCEVCAPWPETAFTGPLIHSALGLAMRLRHCRSGCRAACGGGAGGGAASGGPGCAFGEVFEGGGFRVDSSELDGRALEAGERWTLRVAVLSGDPGPLLDGLRAGLALGLGSGRAPHRTVEERCWRLPPDHLERRAAALTGEATVSLQTPAAIKRRSGLGAESRVLQALTPEDLMHAAFTRGRAVGLRGPQAPSALAGECVTQRWQDQSRWSSRQQSSHPVAGVTGTWRVYPDRAQAWWLALAELAGIGGHTGLGMGVLQARA